MLVRCLQQTMTSVVIHWADEVRHLCQLIQMTYRCSNDAAKYTLQQIGTDLITLLFSILVKDPNSRGKSSPARAIILRFTKVEVAITNMERPNRLLLFLEQMALLGGHDEVIAFEAMHLLAALTIHTESKDFVMQSPTFLDSIIKCCHKAPPGSEIKHEVAKVLQNLTLHQNNKAKMATRLILRQLVALASPCHHITTKAQAIQAMRHISVEAKGKLFIVTYEGGDVLKTLVSLTDEAALQPVILDTLLSLSCNQTASPMVNYPGLIDALGSLGASANVQVADKAAHTIKRLSATISRNQKGHQPLFKEIMALSESPKICVRCWMAKALLEQAKLTGSSFLLVRCPDASQRIVDLANDESTEVQDPAVECLFVLTSYSSNLKRISMNGNMMKILVNAVEKSFDGDDTTKFRARNAVLAILNLTTSRSSLKRAAKHKGIVPALSGYGVSDDDDEELKQAALHGVVVLSPRM